MDKELKKNVTISINKKVWDKFAKRCKNNRYILSGKVEQLVELWLNGKVTLKEENE